MKILFPTDFSTAAENAYIYALKLAERLQASITVLHIYEVLEVHSWIEDSMDMDQVNAKIKDGESEKYNEQIELLKRIAHEQNLDALDVEYLLKESDEMIDSIIQEAKERQVDLIVLGTKGAKGLTEVFFGTTASKVMERANCPVCIVPESATYRGIQNIALALQYKQGEIELIEKAIPLAKGLGAHLHCLHVDVYDPARLKLKKEEYERKFAGQPGISFHTHYELDTEKGILDYMKEHHMDVIIMQVHHRNVVLEMFSHSLSKRLAYHSEVPLIALHGNDKP